MKGKYIFEFTINVNWKEKRIKKEFDNYEDYLKFVKSFMWEDFLREDEEEQIKINDLRDLFDINHNQNLEKIVNKVFDGIDFIKEKIDEVREDEKVKSLVNLLNQKAKEIQEIANSVVREIKKEKYKNKVEKTVNHIKNDFENLKELVIKTLKEKNNEKKEEKIYYDEDFIDSIVREINKRYEFKDWKLYDKRDIF